MLRPFSPRYESLIFLLYSYLLNMFDWKRFSYLTHEWSTNDQIILQESNDKPWKNNNERIKAKNPLLLITRLNYELHASYNPPKWRENTLFYTWESHNYRSTILSTYSFKSSINVLDKISYPDLHDLLLEVSLNDYLQIFKDVIRIWG